MDQSDRELRLSALLDTPVDDLLVSLGRMHPEQVQALSLEEEAAREQGEAFLQFVLRLARKKICDAWQRNRDASDLELGGAIYDIFATVFDKGAVGILAALVVKQGLNRICDSNGQE